MRPAQVQMQALQDGTLAQDLGGDDLHRSIHPIGVGPGRKIQASGEGERWQA